MFDTSRLCSKCDEREAGPGGILCLECRTAITEQLATYRAEHPPGGRT